MRGRWNCRNGPTLAASWELHPHQLPVPIKGDLHLLPVATGGKGRTGKIIMTIVIGGALLATGIGGALGAFGGVAQGATLGAGLGTGIGFMGITYGTVALMGAGILLGGLNMLLTPTPKMPTDGEKKATSFTFDGPANVNDEGGPVPLAYGTIITGGITIASAISNKAAGTRNGQMNGKFGSGGSAGVTMTDTEAATVPMNPTTGASEQDGYGINVGGGYEKFDYFSTRSLEEIII
jgi:predicted phage tail protein